MNSPPEPGSPSPSTPSSGSPPPDEVQYNQQPNSAGSTVLQLASQLSSTLTQNSSKRRLPSGSSFAATSNTRDTKSRRREDSRRMGSAWGEGKEGGKRDKEDLVDISVSEHLRKVIDDPFHEAILKDAS